MIVMWRGVGVVVQAVAARISSMQAGALEVQKALPGSAELVSDEGTWAVKSYP
jgi:hypothetical protein